MNSLCVIAVSKNVFGEVEKTLIHCNLKWNLVKCITTDSSKNSVAEKCLLGQIYKVYGKARRLYPVVFMTLLPASTLQKIPESIACY